MPNQVKSLVFKVLPLNWGHHNEASYVKVGLIEFGLLNYKNIFLVEAKMNKLSLNKVIDIYI